MQNEWPNLLADLKAKREALDQVIATIETHFAIPDVDQTPARRNGSVRNAPKRIKRTDGRTDGRSTNRAASSDAKEPP